jgi:hypothetical protein
MIDRIIDYRGEDPAPVRCPECGSPVLLSLHYGRVHIHGPADRAFAALYGIEGDGPVTTMWESWSCFACEAFGPILMASEEMVA